MSLFRRGPSPHQTAVAMVGVKAGQTAVVLGAGDGRLAAALALVTGLNGRTVVADDAPGSRDVVERAAADAGALVDVLVAPPTAVPLEEGSIDVVAVNRRFGQSRDQTAFAREAVRLIRPGGRVVAIEGDPPRGAFAAFRRTAPDTLSGRALCDLLSAAGLRAVRVLAESGGVTYVEGVKARS